MSKTRTPASIVADAEAAAVAADQHAAELRAAVENGDAAVTPAALAEADQAGVFARLRIKAARKEAAALADAERHKRADQVAADARALAEQDDVADLAVKMRAAVDALAAVHAAAGARYARIQEMVGRVNVIKAEAEQAGITNIHDRYGVGPTPAIGDVAVILGKTDRYAVRAVSPADAVATVVALAMPPGDGHAAMDAAESCRTMTERAKQVCRNVPAVGAVFTPDADRAA